MQAGRYPGLIYTRSGWSLRQMLFCSISVCSNCGTEFKSFSQQPRRIIMKSEKKLSTLIISPVLHDSVLSEEGYKMRNHTHNYFSSSVNFEEATTRLLFYVKQLTSRFWINFNRVRQIYSSVTIKEVICTFLLQIIWLEVSFIGRPFSCLDYSS